MDDAAGRPQRMRYSFETQRRVVTAMVAGWVLVHAAKSDRGRPLARAVPCSIGTPSDAERAAL